MLHFYVIQQRTIGLTKIIKLPNNCKRKRMREMNRIGNSWFVLIVGLVLFGRLVARADIWTDPDTGYTWNYSVNGDTAKISGVSPTTGTVIIPSTLGGYPVTSIGYCAFYGCSGLTSVTIPDGVTSIESYAFSGCSASLFDTTTISGVKLVDGWAVGNTGSLSGSLDLTGIRGIGSSAFECCSGLTSVTIPDSVTNIGASAFFGCSGLTSVTIPNSVTSIGSLAFYCCRGLTSVTIPNSVTSIGSYAFSCCSGLTSLTIPNSVTSIGSYAFSGCSGLTSVTIGFGVTNIGDFAFSDCSGLMSFAVADGNPSYKSVSDLLLTKDGKTLVTGINGDVTIPNSVTSIGSSAFSGCSGLTSVTIPNSVTNIGSYAFQNCEGLTSVTIPNSVTSIGYSAFNGCSGLTSVTIGNGVTSIGYDAFYGCSGLTSVTIPDSVTSIGYSAFSRCNGLTSVTIQQYVCDRLASIFPSYQSVTDIVISDCVTNIGVAVFSGCSNLTSVTIGTSVRNIGDSAFSGCSGLTSVTIPNSVTNVGYKAFYGCNDLTSVTIGSGVTSIGESAFSGCSGLTDLTIPDSVTSISPSAFYRCSGLTNMTIGSGVTSICDSAFSGCRGLMSVTIPNSVTNVGYKAFYGCNDLTSVTIGSGVTSIGESAFSGCSGLTDLTIPDGVTDIGLSAFYNCSGMTNVTIGSGVTRIGESAFSGCSGLTDLTIPDSVTSVSPSAFYGCSGLTSVTIGSGVTSIGKSAFSGCSGLTDLTIPGGVTDIGLSAFYNCSGMTNVTIGSGVTNIGSSAFYGCSGLTSMTLPFVGSRRGNSGTSDALFGYLFGTASFAGGAQTGQYYSQHYSHVMSITNYIPSLLKSVTITDETVIGYGAFSGCSWLTNISIPDSVTNVENYAMYNCRGLVDVTIPDSVTNIGASAFSGCSNLTCVTIGSGVTRIGESAFSGCSGLTDVTIPDSVMNIGASVFSGCSGLMDMTLPFVGFTRGNSGSSEALFGYLFGTASFTGGTQTKQYYSKGRSVTYYIPSSLKSVTITDETVIGYGAFYGCSGLVSVTIPDCVTSVGNSAFCNCRGLTSVTIPDGVTSLGTSVFSGCSGLISVTIPDCVTSIGNSAFYNCSGLTSVTIPVGVMSIGNSAFYNCSRLTSMTIPDSVTSIGDDAFWGCYGLKMVTVPQCVCSRTMSSVFPAAYQSITNVTIAGAVTSIFDSAFSNCCGLVSVTIPDSVTSLGSYAFHGCTSLMDMTIGAGVAVLPLGFIDGCVALTNLTFMSEDTSLGDNNLRGLRGLYDIQPDGYWVVQKSLVGYKGACPPAVPDLDDIVRVMPGALEGCTSLTDLTFGVEARLKTIGTNAFDGCTELRSMTLPPRLEEIGDEAFMGCSYLENVIVPGNVRRVGARAFKNCTGFTAAQIEHGVESLGVEAFYGDWRIAEVDIPSTVTNIGVNAFGGDSSIIRVGLRGDVRSVSEIFSNYRQIREATVKAGNGSIVDWLFVNCSQLMDVRFHGNCPNLVNNGINIYYGTESGLTTYVEQDSTGWDGTPGSHSLPQAWPLSGNFRRAITWWNMPTCLVQFDSNGGTLGVQDTYQRSEHLFTLPPEPVRTGYTFVGWWTKPTGGLRVTAETVFIEDVYTRLYAHWMKEYRVILDPNGGTVTNDYVTYLDQTVYGVLPTAVRTGYVFKGWRYAERTILPSTHIIARTTHTLTAQWEACQYSIRFDPNGGTGEMADQPMVYDVVAPLASSQFAMQGSLFRGWATAAGGSVAYREGEGVKNLSAVADDVVTLYAVWQEKPASMLACEEVFGGAGTVALDEDGQIVVTLTNDVSGTVEMPDNVGVVIIDLNGHDMVGDGGALGESALPGGPAIRIVAGEGDGDVTRLTIGDTSDGEKGQLVGGGVDAAGIEIAEDAVPSVQIDVDGDVAVLNGDGTEQDLRELSPVEHTLKAGEYFYATLAELGYDVPTDGTPYKVVAYGLPAGLKLVGSKAVTKKVGKKTVVVTPANVEWWIEGVPTAAMDFFENPPYLVITVGTAAPQTVALPIEVLAQEVVDLNDETLWGEVSLGQPMTVAEPFYLPGITNSGWTVSGLPTGLKYTAKLMTTKKKVGKKTVVTTNALPYSVYGKTTKAGLFTITAKKKVNALAARSTSGTYYETMKYRVLVRPAAVDEALFGEELTNITTMAYVPVEWDLVEGGASGGRALPGVGKVAKVTGLPTGLSFAAADTYSDKKKTKLKQHGQTIVGTPTKPGTYVVTFTKNVKSGKKTVAKTAQILWTVEPNDAEVELGFNDKGGVIESGVVGLKYGDLMAFTATENATVTASGLPAGMSLVRLEGGDAGAINCAPPGCVTWGFEGYATKAGTYLVTVTATEKGNVVRQRVALVVEGLPDWAKGTFNGIVSRTGCQPVQGGEENAQAARSTNGLATVTVSAAGKISGKFQEGGSNWTFSAACYTARTRGSASLPGGAQLVAPETTDAFICTNVVAKYAYKVTEVVKGKKKTVTKYVTRTFTLTVEEAGTRDACPYRGVATMTETGGSQLVATEIEAWQNLWGSAYKAVGKKLFYTSKKKPYMTFDRTVEVNGKECTLTLKVTTAGAVTATLSYDTGKTTKDKKTKKAVKVIYKATCQTVVSPTTAADAVPFGWEAVLYFAPSSANNFPGFADAVTF